MFRIKICGITRVEDALAAVEAGADAIGLNFFSGSPRCVDRATAARIAAALPADVARVGVFVNADAATIDSTCRDCGLDTVQLHGDEPPELIAALDVRTVLRAFRLGAEGLPPLADYLARCRSAGASPAGVLVDAAVAGQYGGTGRTLDWSALAEPRPWLGGLPLVLAGGLTPDNVAEAIVATRPQAVDTASGVEIEPGLKDVARMAAFVAAARDALD